MEELEPQICRLCLSIVTTYQCLNSAQQDMLQIVVPELNLSICVELFVCGDCSAALAEAFSFKSVCLEIEETIHNYTNNGAVQVNLEKITGLKELEINDKIEKYTKICRTCLNVANSSYYIKISSNEPQLEVDMLQYSLPEMDTKLTMDPVLCRNCVDSLEKQFAFHKKCQKTEERILSYLYNKSDKFKDNFKLFDLMKDPEKEKQDQNILHEELLINDDENEHKPNVDLSIVPLEDNTNTSHINSNLGQKSLKDYLLEELDTAILSCEDNLSHSNSQQNNVREVVTNKLDDLIEEVTVLSDEANSQSKPQVSFEIKNILSCDERISDFSDEKDAFIDSSSKKPYNTRNKRRKIVVDTEDDNNQDPDFIVDDMTIEDESDDDYVEGSEKFGWIPKNRKLPKDTHPKTPSVIQKDSCKFCHRRIFTTIIPQHLVTCSKNPKNFSLVECAHCGMRMITMQKLMQHMLHCQEYILWKNNKSDKTSMEKNTQIQQSVTLVYDLQQEMKTVPKEVQKTASPPVQTEYTSNALSAKKTQSGIVANAIDAITTVSICNKTFQQKIDSMLYQGFKNVNSNLSNSTTVEQPKNGEISHLQNNQNKVPTPQVEDSRISSVQDYGENSKLLSNNINKANTPPEVHSVVDNSDVVILEKIVTSMDKGTDSSSTGHMILARPSHSNLVQENVNNTDILISDNKTEDNVKSHTCDSNIVSQSKTFNIQENVESLGEKIDLTKVDDEPQAITKITEVASVSTDATNFDQIREELMKMSPSFLRDARTQFLGVLKCDMCSYNTRHIASIESHRMTHFHQVKNNQNYYCTVCHKLESGLPNYITHMKELHKHYFYKPFYWCVKCAFVLKSIKEFTHHVCKMRHVPVKMFKSNGVVFCMFCKFESDNISEAKQHIKICELKSTNLQPSEIIEIDDE